MTTEKRLKPYLNFFRHTSGELSDLALKVNNGSLADASAHPKVQEELPVLKLLAEELTVANRGADDGSKTAKALRNEKRAALTTVLKDLGHYVETCNLDASAFRATGFTPIEPRSRVTGPVEKTAILGVEHGNAGQLLVNLKRTARARHYEIRYADVTDGAPTAWSTTVTTKVKGAVPINNLTPGRKYWFEARAFGQNAYTDWCESALRICA